MTSLRGEIAATFALSWPIVLTNVAINFMTTTDVMFLGRLSPEALAAGSLGFNSYVPVFLFCVGVVSAAAPLAAAKRGADARDWAGVRAVGHQAFLTSILLALPLWVLFWNVGAILKAIGEAPELADLAATYMHGLQWALLPALLVFGSGLATTISQSLMFALLVAYSAFDPKLRPHRLMLGRWRFHAGEFAALWRLGAPIGCFIAAEVGTFCFTALAMGLLGAAQIEAHAIALNIAATTFMVPLGVGMAATVRVGHAFGARDVPGVSRAGWTAFGIALAFVGASALLMALAPRLLISAFVDLEAPRNAATIGYALAFVRIAALFQLVDGAQGVLANMLRGVHDSRVPMAMALIGYWLIGAPTGLALGFLTPLGGLGLWIGLAVGLTAVAAMLFVRWRAKEKAGFFRVAA
jgi:MATE family multidrug resistance protein